MALTATQQEELTRLRAALAARDPSVDSYRLGSQQIDFGWERLQARLQELEALDAPSGSRRVHAVPRSDRW